MDIFKDIPPSFIRNPDKIVNSTKYPDDLKPKLIHLAQLFKMIVIHMDKRHHLMVFTKCDGSSCDHCRLNPISQEAKDTFFKMLKQHGRFYDVIPDPKREGHHMRFSDVLSSSENLNFKENGIPLPSKKRAAEERIKKHEQKQSDKKGGKGIPASFYGYECQLCQRSNSGSPYRRYFFHSTADADRHRIIFHPDAERQLQRAEVGKKRGRPIGACTQKRTKKLAKVQPSVQVKLNNSEPVDSTDDSPVDINLSEIESEEESVASTSSEEEIIQYSSADEIEEKQLKCDSCNLKFEDHTSYNKHLKNNKCVGLISVAKDSAIQMEVETLVDSNNHMGSTSPEVEFVSSTMGNAPLPCGTRKPGQSVPKSILVRRHKRFVTNEKAKGYLDVFFTPEQKDSILAKLGTDGL